MGRAAIFAAAILLALPLMAQQQDNSAPAPQPNAAPSKNAPAKKDSESDTKQKPSAAEQNPFPEARSQAAAKQAAQQSGQDDPSAPEPKAGADQSRPSADKQNPFPEDQSQKAADKDSSTQQAPGSGSPGDSAQNYSSSQTGLKDFSPPPATAPDKDEGDGTTANPALARKDTQVGTFYLQTHDYKGAYDRFAEAARIDPGDAEAIFGLAESAQHMNHRDEAIRNYQLYLSALPDGPRAKEARKALREMGLAPKP